MKKTHTISIVVLVAVVLIVSLVIGLSGQKSVFAATTPALGTTVPFGVVSSTFTNSNTSPQTIVNGGVCYTTPPGTPPLVITGSTVTPCSVGTGTDQGSALSDINGQSCTSLGAGAVALNSIIIGANPAGTIPPGCYSSGGAMTITLSTTVTLSGVGTYIFRPGGALTTGANSSVVLAGGASASDVFWAPVSATTIGANATLSTTPTFVGTIIDDAGITIGHFANLLGRALSFGGTVTTDANTITVPATLHVVKLVVNTTGTSVASDFSISVKSSGVNVSGSPAAGVAAPGTTYSLAAGTYVISEPANASYGQSFSGSCDSAGSVTLAAGDDKICTIINTDLSLRSGGGIGANPGDSLVPLIGILKVPTPLALPSGPGPVTYNYTVWNVGGQLALTDVAIADDKCGPVTLLSGDVNGNGKLDPVEIWKYSCAVTLGVTTTNTAVVTGFSDDPYHHPAIATAIATVVVGAPTTPPLINIVKVPSRLSAFPFGGGPVTYTYTVTNPGTVSMHNVTVSDDKCISPAHISGDLNGDNLLDPGEAWVYTCTMNITTSTRNVATADGKANGFTALGYAFADVLVSSPGLPNTGFPPRVKK